MSNDVDEITWPPNYTVRRHKRAKYVRLHTTKKNGLEITIPYRYSLKELPSILEEYKSWIVKQLKEADYEPDADLPNQVTLGINNKHYTISYLKTNRKNTYLHECPGDRLVITGDTDNKEICQRLLVKWAKQQAANLLPALLKAVSEEIDIAYAESRVRSQKAQWGNCSSDRIITLNYRLIFLPSRLVKHILIHELCHTRYLDHSPSFWQLVESFDAHCETNKKALKKGDHYIPAWA